MKKYISTIRKTVIVNAFLEQYFVRIIVVLLLAKGVEPWIAVSLPVVLEFARLISRSIKATLYIALKINYKTYHIIYLFAFSILGIILANSTSIIVIYLLLFIMGTFSGINNACITRLNTSNKKYESFCMFEEERSFTIGATAGLIVSQIVFDFNPTIYICGLAVIAVIGVILNFKIADIKIEQDDMEVLDDNTPIPKNIKRQLIAITSIFAIFAGLWCMAVAGYEQISPLITSKTGYLNALYTGVELIALFVINGKIVERIKVKKKLLLWETLVALCDAFILLIMALTQNVNMLYILFIIMGLNSTIGDPIWGCIMSKYSMNNRNYYVLVNKVYFLIRATFAVISWYICSRCVIAGIDSFVTLAVILIAGILILYIIGNYVNKKIFKTSV